MPLSNQWIKATIWNTLIIVTILSISEISFSSLLNHPQWVSGSVLERLREYYGSYDRNIIQHGKIGLWDPSLGYILKSGTHNFANREFNTFVQINSLGMRDDEASLNGSNIFILGDSHAFGWGVGQDENFPSIFEKLIGEKVLNVSVSSYGTARELKLLERTNPTDLKALIIQYCENDYDENVSYVANVHSLQTMSEVQFQQLALQHARDISYFPGKISFCMAKLLAIRVQKELTYFFNKILIYKRYFFSRDSNTKSEQEHQQEPISEAKAFLEVLLTTSIDLGNTLIVVFEINGHNNNDGKFARMLQNEIREHDYPRYVKNIQILDMGPNLTEADYFILDDHMRNSGHHKVAQALVPLLPPGRR